MVAEPRSGFFDATIVRGVGEPISRQDQLGTHRASGDQSTWDSSRSAVPFAWRSAPVPKPDVAVDVIFGGAVLRAIRFSARRRPQHSGRPCRASRAPQHRSIAQPHPPTLIGHLLGRIRCFRCSPSAPNRTSRQCSQPRPSAICTSRRTISIRKESTHRPAGDRGTASQQTINRLTEMLAFTCQRRPWP